MPNTAEVSADGPDTTCEGDLLLVYSAATVHIVGRLDVSPALVGGLETGLHSDICGSVDLFALRT